MLAKQASGTLAGTPAVLAKQANSSGARETDSTTTYEIHFFDTRSPGDPTKRICLDPFLTELKCWEKILLTMDPDNRFLLRGGGQRSGKNFATIIRFLLVCWT